jgi:hypothetical protein
MASERVRLDERLGSNRFGVFNSAICPLHLMACPGRRVFSSGRIVEHLFGELTQD